MRYIRVSDTCCSMKFKIYRGLGIMDKQTLSPRNKSDKYRFNANLLSGVLATSMTGSLGKLKYTHSLSELSASKL
jgi:hypothetical protein